MMEQLKLSPAIQLQKEFMERYGLREDQVHVEVTVYTTDLEQGRTILNDYNNHEMFKKDENDLLTGSYGCDHVYSQDIYQVGIHRKDGFYGEYVTKEADNDEC